MPRPSGTCATPARAIASGPPVQALAGEDHVAVAAHGSRDGAQRGRLAGAVRAEQRDDLALVDGERNAVQCLHLPVARVTPRSSSNGAIASSFSRMVDVEEGLRRVTFDAAVRDRPRPLLLPALVDRRLDARRHGARLRATPRRSGGRCSTSSTRRSSESSSRTCIPTTSAARATSPAHRRAGAAGPRGLRPVRAARGGRARSGAVRRVLARRTACRPRPRRGARAGVDRLVARGALGAGDPSCSTPGDEVDGWRVEVLRGHADGHIVLLRDGVHDRRGHDPRRDHAGDRALSRTRGPIRSATTSRRSTRIEELAPRVAYAGHKAPDRRPGRRARARSARTTSSGSTAPRRRSATEPRSALRGLAVASSEPTLSTALRRFAIAEALAHLERLVLEGRAPRGRRRLRATSSSA